METISINLQDDEITKLKHALKLAREDLWFLIMHTDCCEQYGWRCGATAEFITKTLNDREEFEPHLQRWIKEEAPNSSKIYELLAEIRDTSSKKPA